MKKYYVILAIAVPLLFGLLACTETGSGDQATVAPSDFSDVTTVSPVTDVPTEDATPGVGQTEEQSSASDTENETEPSDQPEYPKNRLMAYKTTFEVGEPILITAYGGGLDWIGICNVRETEAARWWYLAEVEGYRNVTSGEEFDLTTTPSNTNRDLPAGDYIIYLIGNNKTIAEGDYIHCLEITISGGEQGTEPHPPQPDDIPAWNTRRDIVTHRAHDGFFSGNSVFSDGTSLNLRDVATYVVVAKGWVGIKGSIGQVGYRIDGGDKVYNDSWTYEVTSGATYEAGIGTGADKVARFDAEIPFAGLGVGTHTIQILYKSIDGVELQLVSVSFSVVESAGPEIEEIPSWNTRRDLLTHVARDGFFNGNKMLTNGATLNLTDTSVTSATYKGWLGIKGNIGQFGYRIDNGDRIYNDAWTQEVTSGGTYDAGIGTGADKVARFYVDIPFSGLAVGTYTVQVLYKSADGVELVLSTLTVDIAEYMDPDENENETEMGSSTDPNPDPEVQEIPAWNTRRDIVTHRAHDGFFSGNSVFSDGTSLDLRDVATYVVVAKGWVGIKGSIGQVGYRIDGGDKVYNDSWTYEVTSGATYEAGIGTGADKVARYEMEIPFADLNVGMHTIQILYKSADGVELFLVSVSFSVVESARPEIEEIPSWNTRRDIVTHRAYDGLFVDKTSLPNGSATVEWSDAATAVITAGGWIGVKGDLGQFGYRIDGGNKMYNHVWMNEQTAGAVYDAGISTGADKVARYNIEIAYGGLVVGDHTVELLYRSADGVELVLLSVTFRIVESAGSTPETEELPAWNTRLDIVTHRAHDGFFHGNTVFAEGTTVNQNDVPAYTLHAKGWVGVKGSIGQIGYRIDDNNKVYSDTWTNTVTSGATYEAGIGTGADQVARFDMEIPFAGLELGEHTIQLLYRSTDGIELVLVTMSFQIG